MPRHNAPLEVKDREITVQIVIIQVMGRDVAATKSSVDVTLVMTLPWLRLAGATVKARLASDAFINAYFDTTNHGVAASRREAFQEAKILPG